MTASQFQPDVLSAKEALAFLGVSRMTLHRLMERGTITPVKRPTIASPKPRLKFRRTDLERLAQPVQRAG